MEVPDYIGLLEKISYLEGIIRMVEKFQDPLPLQVAIRDPEMEEIVARHFRFNSGNEFLAAFMTGDNFHKVLDEKFSGENLLFHTRKHRGEHVLPNCHMLYGIRGGCVLRIRDEEILLHEGDTCVIAAGVPHAYYNLSETSIVLHGALTAAFVGSILLPRMSQEIAYFGFFRSIVFDEGNVPSHIFVAGSSPREMTYFISSAFYYHLYRPAMYEEIVGSFMVLFFSYLLQAMSSRPELVDLALVTPKQTLDQIKDYIAANCRSITLRQLAEKFHFNESYLSQYLKKNTGSTFTALLQNARISRAAKMLINTNASVVDIADKVGYQNMSYFYKLFAEVNHCSPAEYRSRFLLSSQRVIGHETI